MASSSSKMTPEKAAAELKRKWSPAVYKEKLQEQLSLAMAFQGPEQKGFTVVGEKSERLEQMRQLNLYRSHLKKELAEEENEGGAPPGFAMPVGVSNEGGEGGAAAGSMEGGEGAATGSMEGEVPQEDVTKKKRKKRKRQHTEAQDDAAEGEVPVDAEGEKKKKRKRKRERIRKKRKLPSRLLTQIMKPRKT